MSPSHFGIQTFSHLGLVHGLSSYSGIRKGIQALIREVPFRAVPIPGPDIPRKGEQQHFSDEEVNPLAPNTEAGQQGREMLESLQTRKKAIKQLEVAFWEMTSLH